MIHKLHKRAPEGGATPLGLSCDESGLYFAGDCALITSQIVDGRRVYSVRPTEDISRVLSAGYGTSINFALCKSTLEHIADHLTNGEVGLAQVAALHLRLPDLADEGALKRLFDAERLQRFNPNHDGRGRFASASSIASGGQETRPQLAPTKGGKAALDAARAVNWVASHPNSSKSFVLSAKGMLPEVKIELTRGAGSMVSVTMNAQVFGLPMSISGDGVLQSPSGGTREAVVSGIRWDRSQSRPDAGPKTIRIFEGVSGDLRIAIDSPIKVRGNKIMDKGQYVVGDDESR